jgi:hypothetical protein
VTQRVAVHPMQEDASTYSDTSSDGEDRVKKRAKVEKDSETLQPRAYRVPNDLDQVCEIFCEIFLSFVYR